MANDTGLRLRPEDGLIDRLAIFAEQVADEIQEAFSRGTTSISVDVRWNLPKHPTTGQIQDSKIFTDTNLGVNIEIGGEQDRRLEADPRVLRYPMDDSDFTANEFAVLLGSALRSRKVDRPVSIQTPSILKAAASLRAQRRLEVAPHKGWEPRDPEARESEAEMKRLIADVELRIGQLPSAPPIPAFDAERSAAERARQRRLDEPPDSEKLAALRRADDLLIEGELDGAAPLLTHSFVHTGLDRGSNLIVVSAPGRRVRLVNSSDNRDAEIELTGAGNLISSFSDGRLVVIVNPPDDVRRQILIPGGQSLVLGRHSVEGANPYDVIELPRGFDPLEVDRFIEQRRNAERATNPTKIGNGYVEVREDDLNVLSQFGELQGEDPRDLLTIAAPRGARVVFVGEHPRSVDVTSFDGSQRNVDRKMHRDDIPFTILPPVVAKEAANVSL